MRCVALSVLLALSCVHHASAANQDEFSDVVVLTDENFEERTASGKWMIDFYAPWCSHCKHLAPDWETAATQLRGDVYLGKYDCTANSVIAKKYKVESYPTIFSSVKGELVPYTGPRSVEALVSFGKKAAMPPVTELAADDVDTFVRAAASVWGCFVAFGHDEEVLAKFAEIAQSAVLKQNLHEFGVLPASQFAVYFPQAGLARTIPPQLPDLASVGPVVVWYHDSDHFEVYTGPWGEKLQSWIESKEPDFPQVQSLTMRQILGTPQTRTRHVVVALINPDDEASLGLKGVLAIKTNSRAFGPDFRFAWINTQSFAVMLDERFKLGKSPPTPALLLLEMGSSKFYVSPPIEVESNVDTFLKEFSSGVAPVAGGVSFFERWRTCMAICAALILAGVVAMLVRAETVPQLSYSTSLASAKSHTR